MKEPKKRFRLQLTPKLLIAIVLLSIILSTANCIVGYRQYKTGIEKLYNDTAYNVAELARTYIDPALFAAYTGYAQQKVAGTISQEDYAAVTSAESYVRTQALLRELRRRFAANDIFAVHVDVEVLKSYSGTKDGWLPFLYIFDSYHIEAENFPLGGRSGMNPEFLEDCIKTSTTGEVVRDNYFVSKSEFGYNTSAIIPILDGDGQVIGLIGVEIPMTTLQSNLTRYLYLAVGYTVVITLLVVLVLFLYMRFAVVRPIRLVTSEVETFVETENYISQSLGKVRTGDEIESLSKAVLQMEMDIVDYIKNITSITAEKERIGAELDVATRIQASMLPCIFPAFPDREEFDIYATMTPAKEVGGDFYDFFMVDQDNLAIVVADVSGKGVPAALFMVIGKTLIKDHTTPGRDLGQVFTEVNALLCEANSEDLFITAFVGVLNLKSGEFRYVNAGHEIPFISRRTGPFEAHKIRPGFVLAGLEGMQYKAGVFQLEPGDKLFQYTDGVTEATDRDDRLYGMERLEAVLGTLGGEKPEEILRSVKRDIDGFVGDAPQFDDITMLCLEYRKRSGTNGGRTVRSPGLEALEALTEYVETTLEEEGAPLAVITKMNIALDEIYSNIVKFAGASFARVTCGVENGNTAYLIFADDGRPYDPLSQPDPDITLSAEERSIGGLGIFMVKKSMSAITYEYAGGNNHLTLKLEF